MTTDNHPFAHEFLGCVATRILNEVQGVNASPMTSPRNRPGTIEWVTGRRKGWVWDSR